MLSPSNRSLAGRSSLSPMEHQKGTKWEKQRRLFLEASTSSIFLKTNYSYEKKMRFLPCLGLECSGSRGEGLLINLAICEQNV